MSAITITEAAQAYLAELLEKQSTPGIGIRIFITQPGTQYAETCIAYCKPGEEKVVNLVELGGAKRVFGLNDLTRGEAVPRNLAASMEKARRRGFLDYREGPATGFPEGWDNDIEEAR